MNVIVVYSPDLASISGDREFHDHVQLVSTLRRSIAQQEKTELRNELERDRVGSRI